MGPVAVIVMAIVRAAAREILFQLDPGLGRQKEVILVVSVKSGV